MISSYDSTVAMIVIAVLFLLVDVGQRAGQLLLEEVCEVLEDVVVETVLLDKPLGDDLGLRPFIESDPSSGLAQVHVNVEKRLFSLHVIILQTIHLILNLLLLLKLSLDGLGLGRRLGSFPGLPSLGPGFSLVQSLRPLHSRGGALVPGRPEVLVLVSVGLEGILLRILAELNLVMVHVFLVLGCLLLSHLVQLHPLVACFWPLNLSLHLFL